MRFSRSYYLRFMAFAMLVLVVAASFTSCSGYGDKRSELLKYVSDDVAVIIAMNPTVFIQSAGGRVENGQVTVPPVLENHVRKNFGKSDRRRFNSLAEVKGINLESVLLAIYNDDDDNALDVWLMYVADHDDFARYMSDLGMDDDKEDGMICYTGRKWDVAVVVHDDVAFILDGCDDSSDAADKVKELLRDAEKRKLASWKSDFLETKNKCAVSLVFLENIQSRDIERFYNHKDVNDNANVLGVDMDIDGSRLAVDVHMFDKNGKPADIVQKTALESFDPALLSFYSDDAGMFGAMSLKGTLFDDSRVSIMEEINRELFRNLFGENLSDYNQYSYDSYWGYMNTYNPMKEKLDTMARNMAFQKLFNDVDAVSAGFRVKDGATPDFSKPETLINSTSYVAGATFSTDKSATSFLGEWNKAGISGQTSEQNCLTFKPHALGGEDVYMLQSGANVILSDVKSPASFKHSYTFDIDDAVAFFSVNMPKDGAFMKALPIKTGFGVKAWGVLGRNSASGEITLGGSDSGFIETLLELVDKLSSLRHVDRESSYDAFSEDYSDEYVAAIEDSVDSVAVEEVVEVAVDTLENINI